MNQITFNQCLAENIKVLCADLIPYLQKKSSFEIIYDADLKFDICRQKILEGEIQFVWLCGLLYTQLRDYEGVTLKPLVAPIIRNYSEATYSSYLVRHKSSSYHTVEDLDGARLAYNEESSFSGYHLLRYCFRKSDIVFSRLLASGGHQQSVEFVREGKADVAAIDTTFYEYLSREKPDTIDALQVIEKLEDFPIPPLLVNEAIDPEIELELKHILLSMQADSDGSNLLKKHAVNRFVQVEDSNYDSIRDAFKHGTDLRCTATT